MKFLVYLSEPCKNKSVTVEPRLDTIFSFDPKANSKIVQLDLLGVAVSSLSQIFVHHYKCIFINHYTYML